MPPTPPLIDVAALAAPVPGADPAGKNPTLFAGELRRLRTEAVEKAAGLPWDDPQRMSLWRDVLKTGHKVLADGSKALDVAVRLVDALARTGGFAGARDGFALLRHLVTDGWDRVWPKIDLSEADDESDSEDRTTRRRELLSDALEARANQMNWLDDPNGGAYFPNVLRDVPLAVANDAAVTTAGYIPLAGRPATVTKEEVEAAGRAAGPEKTARTLEDIVAAREELLALRNAVEARYAEIKADDDDPGHTDKAPRFAEIEKALDDCKLVAEDMVAAVAGKTTTPGSDAGAGSVNVGMPGTTAGPAPTFGGGRPNRVELYAQLRKLAEQLEELEPHSPVPLLVRRAAELKDLAFPELVRQLNQEERVIGFLERSLSSSPPESAE